MYLTELEEWFAIFICFCIVVGFIYSTIHNIKETISEEKQKFKKQKEEEEKVKELINYFDSKTELINTVVTAQKKMKEKKKKNE
jgi:archaellum component FlaF (FlaF/FlaG flagellin family)|tara:strand:+ start:809 stop:1060 length:252 start_codon:yes stop_codon:yes gene_type:complete